MSISIMKNCYATLWSYGEICVNCNCCGRFNKDKKKILKARIRYAREELNRLRNFDYWADTKDMRELQEKNISHDKKYWRREMRKLRERLTKEGK